MNGYLVVLRCGMDDFPVRLFATVMEAMFHADGLEPEDALRDMNRIYGSDASVLCSVAIVEFKDGEPQGYELIRDLDD